MQDSIGNELKVGDTVILNVPIVTGKIVHIAGDSGLVAAGQPQIPMAAVVVQMQLVLGSPNGVLEVIKAATPEPQKSAIV